MLAALLHLAVNGAIYLVGRWQILPGVFDRNGIGYSFAYDSFTYRAEASHLVSVLSRSGWAGWLAAPSELHVKLYSLCFAVFGPLFGHNILAAEPLNLFLYLSDLVLIWKIGETAFCRRTGLIAAGLVAVWPTFLIHSTQLLRDTLLLAAYMGLIWLGVRWLAQVLMWRQAVLMGIATGPLAALVWIVRLQFWEILLLAMACGAMLLLVRQIQEKRWLACNMAAMALSMCALVLVPRLVRPPQAVLYLVGKGTWIVANTDRRDAPPLPPPPAPPLPPVKPAMPRIARAPLPNAVAGPSNATRRPQVPAAQVQAPAPAAPGSMGFFDRLIARLAIYRMAFATGFTPVPSKVGLSSNIDSGVRFRSAHDVFSYLPRAVQIGLFAPFPNMWFSSGGLTGRAGRLVSAAETLAMYVLEALALVALWRERKRPAVWLLVLAAVPSATILALVVVNIGALYRIRLAFWILIIVLGARGITLLQQRSDTKIESEPRQATA